MSVVRSRHGITSALVGTMAVVAGITGAVVPNLSAGATGLPTPQAVGTPPSAPLCRPAVLSQVKSQIAAGLTGRATQLMTLQTAASDPTNHLTPADRQALESDIGTVDLPGIQGLEPSVQTATTCLQLLQAAHSMVVDYRVYYVMTPQTDLTIAVDDQTYVEGLAVGVEPSITTAIATAQAQGKSVTSAQAADADLERQVSAAQGLTSGLDQKVLAQSAQTWPGAWQVFGSALTSVTEAHTDLEAAYGDAVRIKGDLT